MVTNKQKLTELQPDLRLALNLNRPACLRILIEEFPERTSHSIAQSIYGYAYNPEVTAPRSDMLKAIERIVAEVQTNGSQQLQLVSETMSYPGKQRSLELLAVLSRFWDGDFKGITVDRDLIKLAFGGRIEVDDPHFVAKVRAKMNRILKGKQ